MTSFVLISDMSQVANLAPVPYKGEKYASIYRKLGIAQIALGLISILFAIITIGIASTNSFLTTSYVAPGIWCGLLVVIAGILGVKSGRKPTRCLVTAAMIMTIFAAITSGVMFCFEVPVALESARFKYFYTTSSFNGSYVKLSQPSYQKAMTTFHAMLAIIAFIQLVIAIVHSAYCCAVNCCNFTPTTNMSSRNAVIVTTTAPGQMSETAIPGQAGRNVQYIIQGEPGLKQQVLHQPVQQVTLQNQPIFTATQQATTANISGYVEPISYPATSIDDGYIEFNMPQPRVNPPVYEEPLSLQNISR